MNIETFVGMDRVGAKAFIGQLAGIMQASVAVEEIARLAGHASSRTTETVYRHELRPVITTGADVMDKIFTERSVMDS
jgi:hypothetical protein